MIFVSNSGRSFSDKWCTVPHHMILITLQKSYFAKFICHDSLPMHILLRLLHVFVCNASSLIDQFASAWEDFRNVTRHAKKGLQSYAGSLVPDQSYHPCLLL